MSLIFQFARMTVLTSIGGSISHFETTSCSQGFRHFSGGFDRGECAFFAECRLLSPRLCGTEKLGEWRPQAHTEITTVGSCSTPSCVFDIGLHSVTGSGHIPRPAALGLLLRFAPPQLSVPPKTNSLPNQDRALSEFLSVPSEKADLRHLGAGPPPMASPCVTRVNSGIQNGEKKCI
jgi:hypothetical protein